MSLDITLTKVMETEVFELNMTHNLTNMAIAAGIYEHLWNPKSIQIKTAGELIPALKVGLDDLKARPDYFKTFNPENGWGDYEVFVDSVERYIAACEVYPDAKVYTDV